MLSYLVSITLSLSRAFERYIKNWILLRKYQPETCHGQEETGWDSINTARKVVRKSDFVNLLYVSLSIYNTARLT